jgi:hypothetical protein
LGSRTLGQGVARWGRELDAIAVPEDRHVAAVEFTGRGDEQAPAGKHPMGKQIF